MVAAKWIEFWLQCVASSFKLPIVFFEHVGLLTSIKKNLSVVLMIHPPDTTSSYLA